MLKTLQPAVVCLNHPIMCSDLQPHIALWCARTIIQVDGDIEKEVMTAFRRRHFTPNRFSRIEHWSVMGMSKDDRVLFYIPGCNIDSIAVTETPPERDGIFITAD